jgi:CBS domain-containing protein
MHSFWSYFPHLLDKHCKGVYILYGGISYGLLACGTSLSLSPVDPSRPDRYPINLEIKMDKVSDWMSSPVIVIDPDSSVSHALTLMRRRRIHSLVVEISGQTPAYGIITTTDIRDKIIAQGRKPAEMSVRDIMTAPVYTAKPDWTLREASMKMQQYNIHHMPVASAEGDLLGIISVTDIFMAAEEIGWDR